MKKIFGLLVFMLITGLVLSGCFQIGDLPTADNVSRNAVKWSDADKEIYEVIPPVDGPSKRSNAGNVPGDIKITSNSHSAAFPDMWFEFDKNEKNFGWLKVGASVFEDIESFTLTVKSASNFQDYIVFLPDYFDQTAADGSFVFRFAGVDGKNINMVWITDVIRNEVEEPVVVNLGFIGYYFSGDNILSTSIHWQILEKSEDMIDWDAVDAAYDEWVAKGGLKPKRDPWLSSGYASFTFEDYEALGYDDFNIGQLESYYKAYYVDPGYKLGYDFEVTVFHRDAETGDYLAYPGVGESFDSNQEGYIEWLNDVNGFRFLNLWLASERPNDPADAGLVDGYVCAFVSKNDISDGTFILNQEGEGKDIQAHIVPVENGHYVITFWYNYEWCRDCKKGPCECKAEVVFDKFGIASYNGKADGLNNKNGLTMQDGNNDKFNFTVRYWMSDGTSTTESGFLFDCSKGGVLVDKNNSIYSYTSVFNSPFGQFEATALVQKQGGNNKVNSLTIK